MLVSFKYEIYRLTSNPARLGLGAMTRIGVIDRASKFREVKMIMKVVYPDGSWIVGKQYVHWTYSETQGTHHLRVLESSIPELVGKKVAVVISQVKYFILEVKLKRSALSLALDEKKDKKGGI